MGALRAIDMIEHAGFDLALTDHLAYNHYPSALQWKRQALEAIEAVAQGRPEAMVVVSTDGERRIPAQRVCEVLHLDPFVQQRIQKGGNDEEQEA